MLEQRRAERGGAEVEEPLVPGPGVDPDRPGGPQRAGVLRHHPHRVPVEPALPGLRREHPRARVERQLDRAVLARGEARGHAEQYEQRGVLLLGESGPRGEVRPPAPDVGVVAAQVPGRLAELLDVARLVQRVARVRGQRAEQVRPQHRRDHRAEPAAGLAHDRAVRRAGQRAVPGVDPGHDLVAQVGVVAAGPRGVHELAAAVLRPRVHVGDDGRRGLAAREHAVRGLGERLPEGAPVGPRGHVAGVSLDHVHRRVAPAGLVVVTGRQVDPDRPLGRVTQRVAAQKLAGDDALVDPSGEFRGPGQHETSIGRSSIAPVSQHPRPEGRVSGRRGRYRAGGTSRPRGETARGGGAASRHLAESAASPWRLDGAGAPGGSPGGKIATGRRG